MTQVCCPRCRLRFTGSAAASLTACPRCGEPPEEVARAERAIGYQLVVREHHLPDELLRAVAAAKRNRARSRRGVAPPPPSEHA
jgi:anaerobic ribonucleoside-triphosphate reductase